MAAVLELKMAEPVHKENIEEQLEDSINEIEGQSKIEAQITRRFDYHILPWIFTCWLLAFIDRSNIGNARLDGLSADLGFEKDDSKFNTALAVFYILYILVDVPSNWALKYVGGGIYIPLLVVCWGIVGTCLGAVKSYGGLVACRLLLGACEGGMFGGVILYLSMFYKRHDLMLRLGIFYCAAPLSGAIGGLLASGLGQIRFHGYNGWPWIFYVEGAITILVGLVAPWFLPSTPGKASFLTPEEQKIAEQSLRRDASGAISSDTADERFDWKQIRRAIFNFNTAIMSLIFFFILIPIYSYSLFLPTIISTLGYKNVTAQLFTVPPNACGFLSVLACCYLSDRLKRRGPIILGCSVLAIVGYIMLITTGNSAVNYAGTFFVAVGVFPCSPTSLGWLSNNMAPHYVRATALGFMVGFGNAGAFVATFSYLKPDQPRYIKGHAINLASVGVLILLTIANMFYITYENRKRVAGERDHRLEEEPEQDLGHRHPRFRYTI